MELFAESVMVPSLIFAHCAWATEIEITQRTNVIKPKSSFFFIRDFSSKNKGSSPSVCTARSFFQPIRGGGHKERPAASENINAENIHNWVAGAASEKRQAGKRMAWGLRSF